MKHAFAWLGALALSLSLSTSTLHAEGNQMTEDQTKVLDAITTMTEAFQTGDIDRVMASYESQATVLFEPQSPVSDPAALNAMFTGMAAINPIFTYGSHEVIVQGDIALHLSPWTMQATTPDGQQMTQSGLSVAVLRKQPNGDWLMVIDNPHGQISLGN